MFMLDLLSLVFLCVLPGVWALCHRTREAAGQDETIRLERRLGIATGLTVALAVVFWCLESLPTWSDAPAVRPLTHFVAQVGSIPLWFWFAMPLIRVYRPGLEEATNGQLPKPSKPVRSASLTPRKPPSALHLKSTIWTLGLWIIGFALFFYGWKTHGLPEGKTALQHLVLCGMGLIAALAVALIIPLGHPTMFLSPESIGTGRSLELEAAYRKKNTLQGRMILGFILLAISFILLFPITLAFHWHLTWHWGAIGGGFGAIIVIAGGVTGTLMSLHRLKIHRIELAELEQ